MQAADGTPCPMHRRLAQHHQPASAATAGHDHHAAPLTADCGIRSACDGPMAALFTLLSTTGILPESVAATPSLSRAADGLTLREDVVGHCESPTLLPLASTLRVSSEGTGVPFLAWCFRHRSFWACRVLRRGDVNRLRLFVFLAAMCAGALPVFAQQSVDLASVSGRVTDPSGAVVPWRAGHRAAYRNQRDRHRRSPIRKAGSGFRTCGSDRTRSRFASRGSRMPRASLTLTAGAASSCRSRSSVERRRHERHGHRRGDGARSGAQPDCRHGVGAGSAKPADERPQLPRAGAARAGRVARPTSRSTQLFPETSAVPGVSLSVGSQRNLSNNFIVDGLSANDDAAGLSGITYGVDAVEQFQVVTSGAQAELGRALGGYVNVVTKSGTNVLHGTVYDYLRDDRFNAKNALSGTKLPMNQAQYGGSLGGPLVANRTFYFANVEQRRLDQTGLATICRRERGRRSTPGWRRSAIRGRRSPRASIRIRSTRRTCSARSITRSAVAISSASATASTTSAPRTRAAPAA